mgnify:CR=1 FL=1
MRIEGDCIKAAAELVDRLLHALMDCEEIVVAHFAAAQQGLVGDHADADARLGHLRHRFQAAGNRTPVTGTTNTTVHRLVQHPVAAQDHKLHGRSVRSAGQMREVGDLAQQHIQPGEQA